MINIQPTVRNETVTNPSSRYHGQHKVTFLAHKERIRDLLSAGYTIRQIQRETPELASMSYSVLSDYIQRFLIEAENVFPKRKQSSTEKTIIPPPVHANDPVEIPGHQLRASTRVASQDSKPLKLDIKDRLGKRISYDPNAGNEIIQAMEKNKK